MIISEIFYAPQGEGPSIGLPAVFIRLTGCNLAGKCPIPCDTEYSWNVGNKMTIEEIMKEVERHAFVRMSREYYRQKCNRVIITGGEPLLQLSELTQLVEELKLKNFIVEIETNGTLTPSLPLAHLVDQWNVSIKFVTAENFLKVLSWGVKDERLYFKLVIKTEKNIQNFLFDVWDEIENKVDVTHIVLMPETVMSKVPNEKLIGTMQKRLQIIIKYAKLWGFRVTPRLHILAFGNDRRGV